MTDEKRLEETSAKLDRDENDDVEAHKRKAALTDEPADDGDDDVEAHRRKA